MDDALERYPGLRFGLQKLLSTTTPEEYARRSEIVEYMMEEAMRASKGKPRDDADKREEEDESESEPVDEPEHSALHVTDPRKGESTSEQTMTMDVEVEDPGGFVAPPPSRRRNGTGCVPGGLTKLRQSVELCGDCKTQVENLKRSNDPLVTFEWFRPCPTCLSAAISVCPPCEADIHGDGRNRANDGHGKVNYNMLKNKTPRLQIQRHRAADGKLVCKQCLNYIYYRSWSTPSTSGPKPKYGTGRRAAMNNPWTRDEEEALRTGIQEIGRGRWQDIINHPALSKRLTNRSAVDLKDKWRNMCMKSDKEEHSRETLHRLPPPSKRRRGTGSVMCRRTSASGRERWEAVIQQNKKRKVLGVYDTKVEAENACDGYLENPDGFVAPPGLIRRKGTGSVKQSKYGRFTATYKGKHIGTFDTGTQAYSAIDAIIAQGGTSKTNPVTSSTSGLEELAMMALEQPESSKRPRSDDEEDVEKFTDFEIGHLVFARSGKSNWAPAQISAISTSDKGHQVYDVEFFVKEKNGVYPCAQNLPISKLEAADEDTFEKHSGRCKSKNWVEGMEEFRRLYDKSRRV